MATGLTIIAAFAALYVVARLTLRHYFPPDSPLDGLRIDSLPTEAEIRARDEFDEFEKRRGTL